MMYTTPPEIQKLTGVVYGYYTRYATLGPISKLAFDHTGASELAIFIDLDDIMIRISNASEANDITTELDVPILSSIINMCGHYRNFYRSSFGVRTTFFIVVNPNNVYEECSICDEYNHPIPSNAVTQLKTRIVESLHNIVPYLPNVYLVPANCDFNGAVGAIRYYCQNTQNIPCMVISKDPMVSVLGNQNCWILRPKKYNGNDTSVIVQPQDAFRYYYNLRTNHTITDEMNSIVYNTLDAYMVLVGVPSRGIKGVMKRHYSALKLLAECINDPRNIVSNSNRLIDADIQALCTAAGYDFSVANKVIDRFRSINVGYVSEVIAWNGMRNTITNAIIDLYDKELMFKLNETTFSKFPLDLNGL